MRRRVGLGIFGAVMLGVVIVAVAASRGTHPVDPARGLVRVVLPHATGTGFFVRGPDEFAYVVTAHHVVDTGEPIFIKRTVEVPGGTPYDEAYPDVDVVAFDADTDLAILRVRGVRADHFTTLPLAAEPHKDEAILSYGFPESSLASSTSLMSKPGKILSLARFPVYDRATNTVLREDAVDGLLISADIEPGFSGGPSCNVRGEVIGVDVTKDLVHRGQNGAVSVVVLKQLLERVKPASDHAAPTTVEVKALLSRIETEYLLLPIERRAATREQDYVSANDLPRLAELIGEIRKLDNNTTRDPKTQLSGQAALGVALMRLPGRPLETYTASTTRQRMKECELRERGLEEFFGAIGPRDAAGPSQQRCAQLAFRPLVWDLTALALQWEGKDRDISVVKLDTVDADRRTYRASVRFANIDHLVDVWLSGDGGRLRLKLFDAAGHPSGLSSAQSVGPSSFEGTWHRSEPRTARNFSGLEADVDTEETLVVSISTTGVVSATHHLARHIYASHHRLPCGAGVKLDLGIEQSFSGSVDSGSIVAFRQTDARASGADMARCWRAFTYAADQVVVLKLVDGKLVMYRTDGAAFPETAEFQR